MGVYGAVGFEENKSEEKPWPTVGTKSDDGEYWYREIPEAEVPKELRELASAVCDYAEKNLGLPPLKLIWILPDIEMLGRLDNLVAKLNKKSEEPCFAEDEVIAGMVKYTGPLRESIAFYVRADLPRQVIEVILHEARHIWQRRTYGVMGSKQEQQEDAFEYERRHANIIRRTLRWV